MILESFIAKLNANIFLREFSFAKNTFLLSSGQEVEFADHVIWIGDSLIIYQLKEREVQSQTTQDSEIKWFENKVIKKAVKQIRATINFINSKETIIIENQRNIKIHMNGQEVKKCLK